MPARSDVPTRSLARRYRAGQTIVQIGAAVGMSPGAVYYRLVGAGVRMRRPGRQRPDITRADVRALAREGLTEREIAGRLNCSRTAVHARLR
jgi:DNA-binding Lrp family transcriptional regulator